MPIIKSAKKKLRQSKVRKQRNKRYETAYKKALKNMKGAKNKAATLASVYSKIDKASKKNVIHKKKASRLKAKVAKLLGIKTKKAKSTK